LFSSSYSEASAQARQSLKLWPDYAETHATLALALNAQRQFAEGESESREALNIFPANHSAMFSLGMSLTYQHKYKEAIPVLQNLVVALPKMPEARKFLGISLFETSEVEGGFSHLSLYVRSVPQDAEGLRLEPNNPQYREAVHNSAGSDDNRVDATLGMRMQTPVNEYRVTKYNPAFRDHSGAYTKEEWTFFRQIGPTFSGVPFTSAEYERVANAYVEVALSFLRESGLSEMRVAGLENRMQTLDFQNDRVLPFERIGEIIRRILREEFWCRSEGNDGFIRLGLLYVSWHAASLSPGTSTGG
jgi:tetratricopeptide (TPR) repeat protein